MLHNNKQYLIITIILFFFFSPFNGCQNAKKEEDVKIGAVLTLTGSLADLGNHSKNGLLTGVNLINKKGGIKGRKISLFLEDSKTDPKSAVAAITKLINIDKVKYIIGDLSSGTTLAMAPIAEQSKVVLLAPGASNPQMREAGDFIFRNWVSDEFDGNVAASYAIQKLNIKTFSIIEQQNTYCKGLSEAFQSTVQNNNGRVILITPIQDNSLNNRDAVIKIISSNSEAVYIATHTKEGASAVRQLRESGYKGEIISNLVVESPDFAKLAKGAMEGIIYTAPFLNEKASTGIITEFFKEYEKQFGDKPDAAAAHAFDAINILTYAIENAKTDSSIDVKNYFYTIKNYPGASGDTSFDINGDIIKPLTVKKFKNGSYVELEVFKP